MQYVNTLSLYILPLLDIPHKHTLYVHIYIYVDVYLNSTGLRPEVVVNSSSRNCLWKVKLREHWEQSLKRDRCYPREIQYDSDTYL